jgi:feruloyl esterase
VVPKSLVANFEPARTCESLTTVALPDTTIASATLDTGNATIPASCRVTAVVTRPPSPDRITIWIALPMKNWNGRFQGVGGGGFSGGSAGAVAPPLRAGYAAGSTDTGHDGGSGSFALDARGRLNWQAIRNNAYLGIHEMTVTGKAMAAGVLWDGAAARYSMAVPPAGARD